MGAGAPEDGLKGWDEVKPVAADVTVPDPPVAETETPAAVDGKIEETVGDVSTQTEPAAEAVAPPANDGSADSVAAPEENGEETSNGEESSIADPIEPWNRAMFQFNDKLYFWVLKPVSQGYNFVVPEPVRVSVRDFFRNVAMPVRFVSSLFQGKMKGAGTELARFTINSTLGVAGFFDVAKSWFDLNESDEDLGQTLGAYGLGGGMYIVWPIFGPSTVRDTIGLAGDSFLDVANYINPFYIPLSIHTYKRVNNTSLEIGTYEDLKESSIEPYTAFRDAYIQYRNGLIDK